MCSSDLKTVLTNLIVDTCPHRLRRRHEFCKRSEQINASVSFGNQLACLPTSSPQPARGEQRLHEIKHDGFRLIARKDGNRVKLYGRVMI